MKWKNKEKFTEKQAWPDRLDGSYVTYGWVLIFSISDPIGYLGLEKNTDTFFLPH
jgi:hypothetical protein